MKFLGWFWRHKIITLILIALISFGVWWQFFRNGNGDLEESTVGRGEVVEKLILSGQVKADEHAQLTFPTSGMLAWVGVSEGDEVYRGQALAKLDTVGLNSTYQRALSDLRAAEANVNEVHDDLQGNDDDETFDQINTRVAAESAKDKAYEAVVIAEHNLKYSTLYSPFEGVVTNVTNPYSGVNILATQPQVEVINPETIHFKVSADQSEVIEISLGEEVEIYLDSLSEQVLRGNVSYVSYSLSADELSAVYEVKIDFVNVENSDFTYRVGMTGDVHFTLNKKENVLYVPAGFIKSDDKGDYVLVENGKDKAYVEVGLEGEDRIEVTGIEEGTPIYD